MIYVMSDLHGEYDKFIKMLDKIKFSDTDTLYILGDVLDRGLKSLEIIDYIRKPENKNIKLLMGNHEEMCIVSFLKDYDDWFHMWISNGGDKTYSQLRERGLDYLNDFIDYLIKLPRYEIIDDFILVHAGVKLPEYPTNTNVDKIMSSQTPEYLLWNRDFISSNKYINGYTVICGHTPTMQYMQYGKKANIIYKMGKILIDCGAHSNNPSGRLGCLRLDDFQEFYID